MDTQQPSNPKPDPPKAAPSGPGTKSVVIVVDEESLIDEDLRWPLRIAALGNADITMLVCAPKNAAESPLNIDLSADADQSTYEGRICEQVRAVLDLHLGSGQWTGERTKADPETQEDTEASVDERRVAQLRLVGSDRVIEETTEVTNRLRPVQVIYVGSGDPEDRGKLTDTVMALNQSLTCSIVAVIPGKRQDDGDLLAAIGRGPSDRAAIKIALALATETKRRLATLFVEPDIGPDAKLVGRRILDRFLKGALDAEIPAELERRVVIVDDPAKGIIETCREERFECLFLGQTRLGARGHLWTSGVPYRVLRSSPDVTLMLVRPAVPLRNKLHLWIEARIKRRVPQLLRDERVGLVERIQSASQWNFDFLLLMVVSTIIAALGLLADSAAVIIGAMLVAPLMTPLLGLGLGITQGNPWVVKMAVKAGALGFLTAFVLSYGIGFVSSDFHELTNEMRSRGWPRTLDLGVAFVSGIAAAYAYGRPGLLSALPGVAIAAALLPPVATSGLAASIGNYYVAIGAMLLFIVNVVAITLAAALNFWAVGVRNIRKSTPLTRVVSNALIVVAVVMAVQLAIAPPRHGPPTELVQAVEGALPGEFRLREIRLRRQLGSVTVQVDLGGSRLPDEELHQQLRNIIQEHLGAGTGVRLTYRFEALIE